MKKIVFYPILFAINPILLMYAINMNDIPSSAIFPIILIIPFITLCLMWLLFKIFKDSHRVGYILFLFILWFFYYIPFRIWILNHIHLGSYLTNSHWLIICLWDAIIIFLSSGWLWRLIKSRESITMYLNLVCIILVVFSIVRISRDLIPRSTYRPDITSIGQPSPDLPNPSNFPDIYYIILDGYARQDILQELYNYDNSAFIHALENKGFTFAQKSQSNYILTMLSLASTLNMDYLSGKPGITPNQGHLIGMIVHNRSRAYLEKLGYKYVAFSSGYPTTSITDADYYFSFPELGKSQDLEALLLMNSILSPIIDYGWIRSPMTRFSTAQERVISIFNTLGSDVQSIPSPKFVFAHIVATHPPFIFDQNGPISLDDPFVLQGINTLYKTTGGFKQSYVSDLIYINKQVIQTIDRILANSVTPPLIIIQSDHGPDYYMDWGTGENPCLKEKFSNLVAIYFPDKRSSQFSDDISTVNIFPIIFNSFFGTQIKLLPNRQYFATWKNPFPFDDVTDISQNCEIK